MRSTRLLLLSSLTVACGQGDGDEGFDWVTTPIAGLDFAAPAPWATPIEDYIATGEAVFGDDFDRGVLDLKAFDDRLHLGYGDGNVNMGGHIAIEFRSFSSARSPVVSRGVPSGDEVLSRFRELGSRLMLAGPDSTDADELTSRPLIEGNVYRYGADTGWVKERTVPGGEHVHDIALFSGDQYLVGSGAADRTEWEAGNVFRYLWRTSDLGRTMEVVERFGNTEGDSRFIALLSTADVLYLFGYYTTPTTGYIANAIYDGVGVTELGMGPMSTIFPSFTESLPDGTGLVAGYDVTDASQRRRLWHVGPAQVDALSALAGYTVLDLAVRHSTRELVYLLVEGDVWPIEPPYELVVSAASWERPGVPAELLRYSSETLPLAVEYWQGYLFLGTSDGEVWRAERR